MEINNNTIKIQNKFLFSQCFLFFLLPFMDILINFCLAGKVTELEKTLRTDSSFIIILSRLRFSFLLYDLGALFSHCVTLRWFVIINKGIMKENKYKTVQ